jgi:hypothetical protein
MPVVPAVMVIVGWPTVSAKEGDPTETEMAAAVSGLKFPSPE